MFTTDINGNETIYNATLNNYRKVYYSCTIYVVLLVIFFIISISINSAFLNFYWYIKWSNIGVNTKIIIY